MNSRGSFILLRIIVASRFATRLAPSADVMAGLALLSIHRMLLVFSVKELYRPHFRTCLCNDYVTPLL